MKFTINKLPKSEVEIEVETDSDEFDKFFDEAVLEMAENLEIQGFRKGKAPRNIVIEKIGMDKIMLEGAEHAISHFYQKIVKENNLEPISKPEIEIKKLAKGNPLVFKAKTSVLPEIQLPNYKSIASKTKRKKVNVEEKEIDESLKWLSQNVNLKGEGNTEKKMDVPEINDEFARSIGNFESVAALKENIRQGITAEKEKDEAQRIRNEIITNIINETKVDVPDILIEREQQALAHDFKHRVEGGAKTEKDIVDSFKEEAEKKIRIFLALKEIGEKEGIKAEEKEVETEANKMLNHFRSVKEARESVDIEKIKEYVREIIRNEKIFQMLESLTIK